MSEIEELIARLAVLYEDAAKGEWWDADQNEHGDHYVQSEETRGAHIAICCVDIVGRTDAEANAAFISAAHNNMPRILAALKAGQRVADARVAWDGDWTPRGGTETVNELRESEQALVRVYREGD